MPPKSQKAVTGRSGQDEKEPILQGVVIADDFESKFSPLTLEKPRCLLPLANTPLIEYTLEYLASCGVDEVFVYAGAHVDLVEAHLAQSKWKQPKSSIRQIQFIRAVSTSVGDVMRDLDQKHLITGDFIAINGDVVSNFPLDKALQKHRARREKDKNAIMTMVLREVFESHPSRAPSVLSTFVINPEKDRCLHYEESLPGRSLNARIDPELLSTPEIDIRQDLIDCRIDICTPDVLSLWSDNFDNQTPRKDFLYGVLKDYELNGKTIHTYIDQSHYSARVSDLRSYRIITDDIKRGWTSTIAPKSNLFSNDHYKPWRKGIYKANEVTIARSARIEAATMIGTGTSIGHGSRIKNSVVGRRCQIGKNVHVEDAYLWDDVTIGNNVKILKAIIADEVFVGDNSTIDMGVLISHGARVEPESNVRSGKKISKERSHGQQVGQPNGTHPETSFEDDLDDVDPVEVDKAPGLLYSRPKFADSASSLSSIGSAVSDVPSSYAGSHRESFATVASDEDGSERFHHEAVASLFHRMQEDTQADDVRVELMGLRFGHNATEYQVRKAVAVAMMKHIQNTVENGSATAAEASKKTLAKYRVLVQRDQSQETMEDQVDFLLQAQKDLTHRNDGAKILLFVAKDLYDQEIFGEEIFTKWWGDERSSGDSAMSKVREATAPFIQWLENAESESESEGD